MSHYFFDIANGDKAISAEEGMLLADISAAEAENNSELGQSGERLDHGRPAYSCNHNLRRASTAC